jgi:hypothetical protein
VSGDRLTPQTAHGEAATLLEHDSGNTESNVSTQWGFHPEMAGLYTVGFGATDVWRMALTTASADWLGI